MQPGFQLSGEINDIKVSYPAYDISAVGFHFKTLENYERKAANLKISYGDPFEEFETQFIDGELTDVEFDAAFGT